MAALADRHAQRRVRQLRTRPAVKVIARSRRVRQREVRRLYVVRRSVCRRHRAAVQIVRDRVVDRRPVRRVVLVPRAACRDRHARLRRAAVRSRPARERIVVSRRRSQRDRLVRDLVARRVRLTRFRAARKVVFDRVCRRRPRCRQRRIREDRYVARCRERRAAVLPPAEVVARLRRVCRPRLPCAVRRAVRARVRHRLRPVRFCRAVRECRRPAVARRDRTAVRLEDQLIRIHRPTGGQRAVARTKGELTARLRVAVCRVRARVALRPARECVTRSGRRADRI